MKNLTVKFLKADNGDATLIRFLDENQHVRHILIDGGQPKSFKRHLRKEVEIIHSQSNQYLDLVIITHYDDDHIGGIIELVKKYHQTNLIKKYWFNSCRLIANHCQTQYDESKIEIDLNLDDSSNVSVHQAVTLEQFLHQNSSKANQKLIHALQTYIFHNSKITILSPNYQAIKKLSTILEREYQSSNLSAQNPDYSGTITDLINEKYTPDYSRHNPSSIAFLFDYQGIKGLFLADSKAEIVTESLKKLNYKNEVNKRLKLNFVRIAHHGSKKNTSYEILQLIDCQNFIISSNGKHGHPDKVTLARIIITNYDKGMRTNLYFTYDEEKYGGNIFSDKELEQYNFTTNFYSKNTICKLTF